jgi:hypothetical protein
MPGGEAVVRVFAIAFAGVLCVSAVAGAAPYDGSAAMKCTIKTVMVCRDPSGKGCVRGTAATVNLPPVLDVDVTARVIRGAATGRTIEIKSVDRGAGKIMLRGLDVHTRGTAWDLVVDETSGDMSGAVLSRGGYLVFGSCAAR